MFGSGFANQANGKNFLQLSTRVRNAVEQKKRWVSAISAGVSPEGQKLYMAISRTIDQVSGSSGNCRPTDPILSSGSPFRSIGLAKI